MIISRSFILRIGNVSNKIYRENQNTHFIFNNIFPKIVSFMSNVKTYGTAEQSTGYKIIRRMSNLCWINKATNIHSEYVILIALPLHQYLHERAFVLRCTYIACFLMFLVISQRGIHIS